MWTKDSIKEGRMGLVKANRREDEEAGARRWQNEGIGLSEDYTLNVI